MATEPYLGTLTAFGGNFTIEDWGWCAGQIIAIQSNTALFSLLGDMYGGDARTSFGLPDLRGRSPVGMGPMPGGQDYNLGQRIGSEQTALTSLQLPKHTHDAVFVPTGGGPVTGSLHAATNEANTSVPDSASYLASSSSNPMYYKQGGFSPAPSLVHLAGLSIEGSGISGGSVMVSDEGGSQSFSIINPVQVINWQIALVGIYPPRS